MAQVTILAVNNLPRGIRERAMTFFPVRVISSFSDEINGHGRLEI